MTRSKQWMAGAAKCLPRQLQMRHSSYLDVNLDVLSSNLRKIKALAPRASVIPMVKGNAYGHGILEVSNFLLHEGGAQRLGVASLGEALEVVRHLKPLHDSVRTSRHCPSKLAKRDVIVFSDTELLHPAHRRAYSEHGNVLVPMLGCIEDFKAYMASSTLRRKPLHLKVNSGMNRLGLSLDELAEVVIPALKSVGITTVQHVATHLAVSGNMLRDGDKTSSQLQRFKQAVDLLTSSGITVAETSVANSGAIEQGIGIDQTYVRPGLMMYGPASVLSPRRLWTGRQVGCFETRVLKTFAVRCGECVGYGFHPVPADSVVAILGVGYADGFQRYNSGLPITINGISGKIFGAVNMDMAAVRFDLPTLQLSAGQVMQRVKVGSRVRIWCDDIQERADFCDTIPYELMCALSVRVPRIYSRGKRRA